MLQTEALLLVPSLEAAGGVAAELALEMKAVARTGEGYTHLDTPL